MSLPLEKQFRHSYTTSLCGRVVSMLDLESVGPGSTQLKSVDFFGPKFGFRLTIIAVTIIILLLRD